MAYTTVSATITSTISTMLAMFRETQPPEDDEWAEEPWQFSNPVKLHELVYLHVLLHVALALDPSFQAKVWAVSEAQFGPHFSGFHAGPIKTFRRMLSKMTSPAEHRYVTERPRPALNTDLIRCRVVVADVPQMVAFLAALADEFDGFVSGQSCQCVCPDAPGGPCTLPVVTVNVLHMDRTYGTLCKDGDVKQQWNKYGWLGRAHLDWQPESRRAAQVQQARQWLEQPAWRDVPARLVGEVQVMTRETYGALVRCEELRCILQSPTPQALQRNYNTEKPTAPRDLYSAAELGELSAVASYLHGRKVNAPRLNGPTALDLAASHGHPDVVDFLLRHRAHPHNVRLPQPALVMAAAEGHTDVVRVLLAGRADPNRRGQDGTPSLVAAAASGYADVVQVLVQAKADPNRPTKPRTLGLFLRLASVAGNPFQKVAPRLGERRYDRLTPLCAAARQGVPEVAQALLQARAYPNVADGMGRTPLMEAAALGHVGLVAVLLEAKADPQLAPRSQPHPCALASAAALGHARTVAALLRARADPDQRDREGQSCVFAAAAAGHVEPLRLLLEGNGDPDLPRADGWTPLYAALAGWHRHAAHLLLQRGARPDCPLPTERSPLLIAVLKGYPEVVDQLLARRADPDAGDVEGDRPLVVATVLGRAGVLHALLTARADPTLGDGRGNTPLHHAARFEDLAAVRALLACRADPHALNGDGVSPALQAASLRRCHVLEALLEGEGDPNRGQFSVNALLLRSVAAGFADVAATLVRLRGDPDHRGAAGRSALEIARQADDPALMQALLPPSTPAFPAGGVPAG
eukprot:EG_transcript_1736